MNSWYLTFSFLYLSGAFWVLLLPPLWANMFLLEALAKVIIIWATLNSWESSSWVGALSSFPCEDNPLLFCGGCDGAAVCRDCAAMHCAIAIACWRRLEVAWRLATVTAAFWGIVPAGYYIYTSQRTKSFNACSAQNLTFLCNGGSWDSWPRNSVFCCTSSLLSEASAELPVTLLPASSSSTETGVLALECPGKVDVPSPVFSRGRIDGCNDWLCCCSRSSDWIGGKCKHLATAQQATLGGECPTHANCKRHLSKRQKLADTSAYITEQGDPSQCVWISVFGYAVLVSMLWS